MIKRMTKRRKNRIGRQLLQKDTTRLPKRIKVKTEY
jgi:hypothetical protein